MTPLKFCLVLGVVLISAPKALSHADLSSVNNPPSMVMWQNVPIKTVVASHLQMALTLNTSKGAQQFYTTLHRDNDSHRETLTSKGYNFSLKFRENKFVPLENGNKATFDCQVEPPFIGYSKPWIEVDTGNMYCLFFPYSKEEASFALLLGKVSLSGTGKMMNITTELNNVFFSILENSNVQFHWSKKNYLSVSLWDDFGIVESEVKKLGLEDHIIVMLAATGHGLRMIIRYEIDESQIPAYEYSGVDYIFLVLAIIFVTIFHIKVVPWIEIKAESEAKRRKLEETQRKEKSTTENCTIENVELIKEGHQSSH